jgi:hypothetical protein
LPLFRLERKEQPPNLIRSQKRKHAFNVNLLEEGSNSREYKNIE